MMFLHHVVVFFIGVIDPLAVGVAIIFNVIEFLKEDSVEGMAGRERKKGKQEGREGEQDGWEGREGKGGKDGREGREIREMRMAGKKMKN